jgi:hypothetical protein
MVLCAMLYLLVHCVLDKHVFDYYCLKSLASLNTANVSHSPHTVPASLNSANVSSLALNKQTCPEHHTLSGTVYYTHLNEKSTMQTCPVFPLAAVWPQPTPMYQAPDAGGYSNARMGSRNEPASTRAGTCMQMDAQRWGTQR